LIISTGHSDSSHKFYPCFSPLLGWWRDRHRHVVAEQKSFHECRLQALRHFVTLWSRRHRPRTETLSGFDVDLRRQIFWSFSCR